MTALPNAMVITWSEEDNCYLVHLPDFPEQHYRTHDDIYEEAARNGKEVLELLLEDDGLPHPQPQAVPAFPQDNPFTLDEAIATHE